MHLRICALIVGLSIAFPAWAGDEDVRIPKPEPVDEIYEPPEPPPPEEYPELSLGDEEEQAPEPPKAVVSLPTRRVPQPRRRIVKRRRQPRSSTNPDENLDTTRVIDWVRRTAMPDGVLRPALGTRGYRPSMIAVGVGDRTPGYGLQIEHSFNRLGLGFSASYLPLSGDLRAKQYSFYNLYGMYRWLPFAVSPYLHGGVQYGLGTPISFGLLGGVGIEARVYQQWTLITGYTFHSIAEKGYWGGAVGWMF